MKEWKYMFGALLLIAGIMLNLFNIGSSYFLGYASVGNFLIFCAIIIFIANILRRTFKKENKIDERMISIAFKASRITFVAVIFGAFIVMIFDGIKPIIISYSMFMSYFICFFIFFYALTYKIILKYY